MTARPGRTSTDPDHGDAAVLTRVWSKASCWVTPRQIRARIGGIAGLVNGLLVVATRINGFIVTLATMTIIAGQRYGVHGTGTYDGYTPRLVKFGRASVLGLPTVAPRNGVVWRRGPSTTTPTVRSSTTR